jgi:hypothetical protein
MPQLPSPLLKIDKNGNIVSAFAPPTGKGLEELITNTLK